MSLINHQPETVKTLLDKLIETKGWEEKLDEAKLPDIWLEIVGEKIGKYAKTGKFENGILIIITESSTWRSELKLRSEELIGRLNEKLGKEVIKSLKIK
jgi:predicted nucleic acid-binding Zn ribbon protein